MNHVCFAGELTHEPVLDHRGSEPVCELAIRVRNKGGAPTHVLFEARREQAYACAEYCYAGRRLAVVGRMLPGAGEGEPNRVLGWVEFLGGGRRPAEAPAAEASSLALALAGTGA